MSVLYFVLTLNKKEVYKGFGKWKYVFSDGQNKPYIII